MKKTLFIVIAIALSVSLLCGCGSKKPAETEPAVGLPNPITQYKDAEAQSEAKNFGLEAPEGATDVVYQSIDNMVETIFTLDGVKYNYRAEQTGELESYDISGLYLDFTETVEGTVQYCAATASVCAEGGYVRWMDVVPGVNYNLVTASEVSADTLFEVAELVFVPLQGNAG